MKWINKVIAVIVALTLVVGIIPTVKVMAATDNASLSNLGSLGTVEIGNKSESGTWYQTKIGNEPAFCMDLGLACQSGDVFESTTKTISSASSNTKNALEARVGYWYDETKGGNRKAWVYAQCLIWSIEEGYTSKSDLTSVIRQVRSNTGYYDGKTAAELYTEIFGGNSLVTCEVTIWNYQGSGSSRQRLMRIESGDELEYEPDYINATKRYRQRITLFKEDEDGNALPRVTFRIKANNIKELYAFKANGLGAAESGELEEGVSVFELVTQTDSKGKITYKFDYQLQSEDYAYVKAADLENMTADDKKAMRELFDEQGYKYANNLTKAGAENLADADIERQLSRINNTYVLTEVDTGNGNLLLDPEWKNGKTITIGPGQSWTKVDGEWPDSSSGEHGNYSLAYKLNVENKYKKISLQVKKSDAYSSDGKAHGEATLDGARYQLFNDKACTQVATVYGPDGSPRSCPKYYTLNGTFTTDYIRTNQTVYLKEVDSPDGYYLSNVVETITPNGSLYNAEYTPNARIINMYETPVPGYIAIEKFSARNEEDIVYEEGAKFQVYLKSAGSYENADQYERSIITTDENGYGISGPLYKGRYVIHQVSNGTLKGEAVDLIKADDFEVEVKGIENQPVYTFKINNPRFKAYLKIIKKDKRTEKTILKEGTTYQIKLYDKETDTWNLITQSYIEDGIGKTTETFICNENGEIVTYEALESGEYRIYETNSVTGTYRETEYIPVTIHQNYKDSYETWTDADGNEHLMVTVEYVNEETKGKFTLDKRGFELTSFVLEQGFKYESVTMPGTTFELFAKEDIETQDNQGTYWFKAGDKVATITTGEKVEFTDDCKGICTYNIEDDGSTTMYFPLGKYELKEVDTLYSYFLPEVRTWDLEFEWNNQDEEYVFNITDVTDEEGILSVQNELVQTDISMHKSDKDTSKPVKDAVFGFYSRDNIYNAKGEIIVKKDEKIATITTNEDGVATLPFSVPLMSEGYNADATEEDTNNGLNSGNYYWKEESISGSYYLDNKEIDIHLEYVDQLTTVISSDSELTNTQTDVMVSKLELAGSTELLNCDLKITDTNGNIIVCWTTGVPDSIGMNAVAEELGYRNLIATMDDKGNVTVKGLLHEQEYTLTETRPCNGYATAEDIIFKLASGTNELGDVITEAYVKDSSGNFIKNTENKVLMYDDTTKIEFNKYASNTENYLPGTKWQIKDKNGAVVYEFTTGETSTLIEGVLIAGETYTFVEVETLDSYELTASFDYTVIDTSEVQKIDVTNQYKPGSIITSTPDDFRDGSLTSPKTGYDFMKILIALFVSIIMMLLSALGLKKSTNASKCFFFLLLLLAGFSMTENVNAAETVTEIVTYEANEPNQGVNVSKTKKIDGKKYKVDDIKYEVISEEVVTEEATTTITKVSDVVKKGETYSAEDTITENDIVYNLKNTTEEETVMEYRFEQSVTGWNDYTSEEAAKKAPLTKDVKVINEKTGMEQIVTCTQTGMEKLDTTTWVDTYIDITFIAYDADSFIWNGIEIQNTENPLEGYEKELIESVGGTTDNYRVVRIEWDGDMYLNEDNVPCRNARASVQKKVPYWRVSYTGNIIEEEVVGVVYTSTYEGTQIKETDKTNYTIKATITYEQDNTVVVITVGIIILIILVVGMLFIIKKKR